MASNFWTSTHGNYHLHPRNEVLLAREYDRKHARLDELGFLEIWLADIARRLGSRLNMRQRVIATALTFMKRFYLRNAYAESEIATLIPACLYVAAKVEEAPVHLRTIHNETQKFWKEIHMPYKDIMTDASTIAEMEFFLIEELDFHLIIYQPYNALLQLMGLPTDSEQACACSDSGRLSMRLLGSFASTTQLPGQSTTSTTDNEGSAFSGLPGNSRTLEGRSESETDITLNQNTKSSKDINMLDQGKNALSDPVLLKKAWALINDSYRTSVCLIYPPHCIALACLYIAAGVQLADDSTDKSERNDDQMDKVVDFLARLDVDIAYILEVVQEIVSMFHLWNYYETLVKAWRIEADISNGEKENESLKRTHPIDQTRIDKVALNIMKKLKSGWRADGGHVAKKSETDNAQA